MLHLATIAAYWRYLVAATAITALGMGAVPFIVPEPSAVTTTAGSATSETTPDTSGWDSATWTTSDEPEAATQPDPEATDTTGTASGNADVDAIDTDEAANTRHDPATRTDRTVDSARRDDTRSAPDKAHHTGSKHRTRAASKAADPSTETPNTPANTPASTPDPSTPPRPQFPIAIGSWNMLGASHTEGRGCNRCHLPNSIERMPAAVRAIARHNLDVLGLQEFQPNQQDLFTARMPAWKVYANADNAVAWNTHTFAFVSASTVTIPYFGGSARQMPLVRLKHLRTGREIAVLSVHNPADVRGPARQWREAAVRAEATAANTLTAADVPVFLTGDMNDRAEFFCHVTAISTLIASAGGARDTTACTPPARMDVDWILGSASHVTFTSHTSDDGPDVDFASDHPLVAATATVS